MPRGKRSIRKQSRSIMGEMEDIKSSGARKASSTKGRVARATTKMKAAARSVGRKVRKGVRKATRKMR